MERTEWEFLTPEQWDFEGDAPSLVGSTDRLKVPGGWLYRCTWMTLAGSVESVTLAFVPDVPPERCAEPR